MASLRVSLYSNIRSGSGTLLTAVRRQWPPSSHVYGTPSLSATSPNTPCDVALTTSPYAFGGQQCRFLKRPNVNTSQLKEGRRVGALAMKVGMIAVWNKWGERYPCTVLHLDECQVVQVKTEETDGYTALQLGVGEAKRKNKISVLGHYEKHLGADSDDIVISRKLSEFRVTKDALLPAGTRIEAAHFVPGQLVDVCGTSKGKGFQGAMKRWGFKGQPASHGNSLSHRALGSTGNCQDPGRVFKNKKMAGRMGGTRVTKQNLYVVKVDTVKQLVYVHGAVPGTNGSFVRVVDAVKGPFYPSPPPFPTFVRSAAGDGTAQPIPEEIFAPVPEQDTGILPVPDNPF